MNVLVWVIAIVLAAVFLLAGSQKLMPARQGAGRQQATEESQPGMPVNGRLVKVIGVLEILAAVGLTLPPLLDIAPVLAPLAAVGLVLLMIGAAIVHWRRSEYTMIVTNVILLALAATVAWGRFGPYSFTS